MDKSNSFYNNSLIIQSNKKISKEDLEFVYLYFETPKHSDGGDICKYNYDAVKDFIYLTYFQNNIKQKVLQRKQLAFGNYKFQAYNDNKSTLNNYDFERNILILKNIDKSLETEKIELYLDYLVQVNVIEQASFSNIYENTLYVKFQNEIDFEEILEKLSSRPILCNQKIQIYQAFNTNSVLLKLNHNKSANELKRYLMKNFYVENKYYWQSYNDLNESPFAVVHFKDVLLKDQFLETFNFDIDFVIISENNLNDNLIYNYIDAKIIKDANAFKATVSNRNNKSILHTLLNEKIIISHQELNASYNESIIESFRPRTPLATAVVAASVCVINGEPGPSNNINAIESYVAVQSNNDDFVEIIEDPGVSNGNIIKLKAKRVTGSVKKKTRNDILSISNVNRLLYCKFCAFRTKSSSALTKHELNHQNSTGIRCQFCNFHVHGKNASALSMHMKNHLKTAFKSENIENNE